MRISELADEAGVPVGTIKFYLREELLPPGRLTSRTSAEYDQSHVERIRLIRALTDEGGLEIAAVHRIIDAIDSPHQERVDMLGLAQRTLLGEDAARERPREITPRVRALAERRGWTAMGRPHALLTRLEAAWQACDEAGVPTGDDHIDAYAEAMSLTARADIAHMPRSSAEAMRMVVVGNVMSRGLLDALRMLEQREAAIAMSREGGPGGPAGPRGPAGPTGDAAS